MTDDPVGRLRALCLALPEVTEKISHGEPTWFVQPGRSGRVFVMLADHHHDDRLAFWCAAPPGAQEELVAAGPERFFRPPYVGHRGWLGVWLDVPVGSGRFGSGGVGSGGFGSGGVDWVEIAEIVTDAYREIAPKKLVARLGQRRAVPP